MRKLGSWESTALRRRFLLFLLVVVPTVIASEFMAEILPYKGSQLLEQAIIVVFGILFGWISVGLWTAIAGFMVLIRTRPSFSETLLDTKVCPFSAGMKVAVVMPVYCEEPRRFCSGIEAMYRSIEERGKIEFFDFFILSDSDNPDSQVEEEISWANLCRKLGGVGKIFYRIRKVRLKKKSGNIAEFCRRWGSYYKYMIVLDADSLMGGKTLVRLVEIMESHPEVGLIQTVPKAISSRSLYARIEQFSSHLLGSLFAAGIYYWQLGDGQYWGHNAIIRVEPFMKYCGLPKLSTVLPWGGEILSHDFVESALLRKSGYSVWLAYDLEESYEEIPPTLIDSLKRDRRWCQGNLQHLRLIFSKGLFVFNRFLFLNGVMAYGSAFLWGSFLVLTTLEMLINRLIVPNYFPYGLSLFPRWPVFHFQWAVLLFSVTLLILFLPKLLGVILICLRKELNQFGGLKALLSSVFLEILFSTVTAPIKAHFHGLFITAAFLGKKVSWGKQLRQGAEISWKEGFYHFFPATVTGVGLGVGSYLLSPSSFWWLIPLVFSLSLSIPLSVISSRVLWGEKAKEMRLFLTPPETTQLPITVLFEKALAGSQSYLKRPLPLFGFRSAVVDPFVHALHLAILGLSRCKKQSRELTEWKEKLIQEAILKGPDCLSLFEKKAVLWDPYSMECLHKKIWTADRRLTEPWGIDFEQEAERIKKQC
ncbi:glucans biosynthesis glucosyltransferase MdoH [Candidatus Methylacidiphilum infernorum]|nr:glucans biosynthesis glucosyltransferase MdoH [Candidatus Methylacidiphilum infernorum]